MPKYNEIFSRFEENGCHLLTSEVEYKDMKVPIRCTFKYVATCGHKNTVTLINYWYKKTGLLCKNCVYLKQTEKIVTSTECMEKEYEGFKLIVSNISDEFDITKTYEGCLADMLIKPKYQNDDKWMMIQIKTTEKLCHSLYSFQLHNKAYTNCIIACICLGEKKLWVIDGEDVLTKSCLNVGCTKKSEYFRYQVDLSKFSEILHNKYAITKKFKLEYGLKPISICQQQEQFYRRLREHGLQYIKFDYDVIDAQVFDFCVNKYKIQEKVATPCIKKNGLILYIVFMYRSTLSECYNKGDNDFYWIWKKNDLKTFYIIPESELIDRKYIQVDGNLNNKKKSFTLADWTNMYKYTLDEKDLQKKLEKLFM
jgi:hypothetical protein